MTIASPSWSHNCCTMRRRVQGTRGEAGEAGEWGEADDDKHSGDDERERCCGRAHLGGGDCGGDDCTNALTGTFSALMFACSAFAVDKAPVPALCDCRAVCKSESRVIVQLKAPFGFGLLEWIRDAPGRVFGESSWSREVIRISRTG